MYKMGLSAHPTYKSIKNFVPAFLIVITLLLAACDSGSPTSAPTQTNSRTTTAASTTSSPAQDTTSPRAPLTVASATNTTTLAPTLASNTTASVATSKPTVATTPGGVSKPALGLNQADQVLRMVSGDVTTLDPALASEVSSSFVVRQLFSGLVTLDNNLNVVPDLAAAMPTVSDSGKTYTFTLKQGIHFASGKEITADDVKYSLERAADPTLAAPASANSLPAANYMNDIVGVKEKLSGKADSISGITVKDKYTIQFQLDGPKPYFLDKMTFNCFFVVNKSNVEKSSNWFEQPDASGPFKLDQWSSDQLIRLKPNANYANGKPYLNEVDLLLGSAAANALNLYEDTNNKIDLLDVGAGANVERALDKNSPLNKQLVVKPDLELTYLAYNNKVKPFDDPKIRQAFSLVVDRAKIARAMFEGKVVEAKTILPPGMPGYTGNAGAINYDVSRARDLIAQSSYKSPANLPKIVLYSTGDALAGTLQALYKQTLGIDVEVRQYEYKDFQTGLDQGQFQMFIFGWTADYPDPENFLRSLLGTASPYNNSNYSNQDFDNLLQQADQQSDAQKRLQMYGEAEQIALNDAAILPIYHDVTYMLVKPYVKNLVVTGEGIISLKEVYVQK